MKIRLIVSTALLILVALFALQNSEMVEVVFLFWALSLPRALLIFLVLSIGVVVGWFVRATFRLRRNN